ncbi:hypothetical protein [Amycolatopsis sp. NPDC058986]|uniref:hypothetical protein n=1 Tax=unclassified Amycolatopsis TaxID=2618356 RepID=UPI00366A9A97
MSEFFAQGHGLVGLVVLGCFLRWVQLRCRIEGTVLIGWWSSACCAAPAGGRQDRG